MTDQPVPVIGFTSGKTAPRVVRKREATCITVRRVGRRSETPFDRQDPATLAPVGRGMSRADVTHLSDLAFPGAIEMLETLTGITTETVLQRVVPPCRRGAPFASTGEDGLRTADLPLTIMQAACVAQHSSEGCLQYPVPGRAQPMRGADLPEPIIDIAILAVRAPGACPAAA
jgi:hypothetical protein